MKFLAPAKINLFLEIIGKDAQKNLHFLHSLMIKIGIYDEITIMKSDEISVEYTGRFAQNISNDIILKTINLVKKTDSHLDCNYHFHVEKNIPHGSGLGGASSNASTVLKFLTPHFSQKDRLYLGLIIGADVPFFLTDGPQIATGFGEKLSPIDIPSDLWTAIIKPDAILSTKEIFSIFGNNFTNIQENHSFDDALLRKNDLLPAALELLPQISDLLSIMQDCNGVLKCDMSGSGSAIFGIFQKYSDAEDAIKKFDNINCFVNIAKVLKN